MGLGYFELHIVELGRCWLSSIPLSKSWHLRKPRNAAATTSSILRAAFEKLLNYRNHLSLYCILERIAVRRKYVACDQNADEV